MYYRIQHARNRAPPSTLNSTQPSTPAITASTNHGTYRNTFVNIFQIFCVELSGQMWFGIKVLRAPKQVGKPGPYRQKSTKDEGF